MANLNMTHTCQIGDTFAVVGPCRQCTCGPLGLLPGVLRNSTSLLLSEIIVVNRHPKQADLSSIDTCPTFWRNLVFTLFGGVCLA